MMHFVEKIMDVNQYKLTLMFNTGEIKEVDLEEKIKLKSGSPGSKYSSLLDINYFKSVKLQPEWKTIYWDNELDFCPDVLYTMGKIVH